eukprot:299569-Chlamydomonas_euryale.AAC.1
MRARSAQGVTKPNLRTVTISHRAKAVHKAEQEYLSPCQGRAQSQTGAPLTVQRPCTKPNRSTSHCPKAVHKAKQEHLSLCQSRAQSQTEEYLSPCQRRAQSQTG